MNFPMMIHVKFLKWKYNFTCISKMACMYRHTYIYIYISFLTVGICCRHADISQDESMLQRGVCTHVFWTLPYFHSLYTTFSPLKLYILNQNTQNIRKVCIGGGASWYNESFCSKMSLLQFFKLLLKMLKQYGLLRWLVKIFGQYTFRQIALYLRWFQA